jgi:hypothetical protein
VSTHLAGFGLGDNAICLWNFWWMRRALASGLDFFQTNYLFVPVGVNLTLHTHTAFSALVGATVLRAASVTTALNVTLVMSLWLNAFAAYLLAFRLTGHRSASVIGGMVFGFSPYLAAHLNGHFNLTTAWTIPLFVVALLGGGLRGSLKLAVMAGLLLSVTAYIDYYYVVYEVVLALGAFLLEGWSWSITRRQETWSMRAVILVWLVIGFTAAACLFIVATGGTSFHVGHLRVSMYDTFNLRQLLWFCLVIAVWMWFRPQLAVQSKPDGPGHALRAMGVMLAVFFIVALPLVQRGIGLLLSGEYVTPVYLWRSAPIGIDVATLLLGNPFQGLWGSVVRHWYLIRHIDVIESGAWLGIVPVALAFHAIRSQWSNKSVQHWAFTGALFFVWALGSHVHVFGWNTGMVMPGALLRYVPLVANARMPGRAMVLVYLALGILTAVGAASYAANRRNPMLTLCLLGILVLADFVAAPFPTISIQCPEIYYELLTRPEPGALAELPLSVGDGFGAITPIDAGMFVCQTVHGRPVVGGAVARLSRNVLAAYRADPLLAAWLRLSGAHPANIPDGPLPSRDAAGERLIKDGIAFVMLNRQSASATLRNYVEHQLPLRLLTQDGQRSLYRVEH